MTHRRHWLALFLVIGGSFAILGGHAPRIRSSAPPMCAPAAPDQRARRYCLGQGPS